MSKKLAIKGHPTRGKEVIELLKMLGGINDEGHIGTNTWKDVYYYLDNGHILAYDWCDAIKFTLEGFLEKFPYKVGDKVEVYETGKVFTIGNMIWEDELYTVHYANMEDIEYYTAKELKPYKEGSNMKDEEGKLFDSIIWHLRNSINNGKQNLSGGECEDYFREVVKKNNENKMKNVLAELLKHIKTTPKEELEKEFNELEEWSHVGPTVEEFMTFCECVNKKPTYPKLKNLTECREILGEKDMYQSVSGYKGELLTNFQRLLIFRDAYWKIAGEEMGLGKPWKPDWNDLNRKYFISLTCAGIGLYDDFRNPQVLVFPTEEMRDVFYENFKDLIEQCKELL